MSRLRITAALLGLALLPIPAAHAIDESDALADIVVTARPDLVREQTSTTSAWASAEEIARTTNVINAEDSLRYFPNIFVRKRHVGDTQAPITTRTSGVGASARSLIYADGVLLSALVGNNNSNASPKWGMVSPDEIAGVDVLYGPFSAAYAGNSIGAVVEIQTRMPDAFEATLSAAGSLQAFEQYATDDSFGAHQMSAAIGDRFGSFSFWLGAQRTESESQPLAYATATRPAAPSAAGAPLTGAFADRNRTGAPIVVLGASGLEHQVQDNVKLRARWNIDSDTHLTYSIGRFGNDTDSTVNSYLRNGAGQTVYAGGPFNISGYSYALAANAFSNNVYRFDEEHWMQSLALNHHGDRLDWRIVASAYDYGSSEQRTPSTALPAAFSGGAGSITRFDGTGWTTLDGKAIWRVNDAHELSFGAHFDAYELANNRFTTTSWISGGAGALASAARGETETRALWVQDVWRINPALQLTLGGRWEDWRARDGLNFSASPALNVSQPALDATEFSPKASLEWTFATDWTARASVGRAYRFPTVGELYQAISTGATLTVPNPNLRPENALSTEWTIEHELRAGRVRLSIFTETIEDALISQTAPLASGSPTLFNYVQNIDEVRSRGVELVGEREDVLIEGLSLSGSVTYVDPEIVRDTAFPAAEGKQLPQVPNWRATLVATYRRDDRWAFTLAARYSDRVFATIDNSDSVSHTYQGFDGYLVFDARAHLAIGAHWTAAIGIENLGAEDYFLFHPFPQRTATAELQYRF
jgi:iron complex outermembrane receptor protein